MCGITGWVSFDGDPRQQAPTIDAMIETMACRGPDAGGRWLDRHVANRRWLGEAAEGDPARMPTEVRNGLERALDLHTWLDLYRPTPRLS